MRNPPVAGRVVALPVLRQGRAGQDGKAESKRAHGGSVTAAPVRAQLTFPWFRAAPGDARAAWLLPATALAFEKCLR
ncbi:hypothetical protein GCM10010973_23600 [Cribrihabitans marinus]|nr:hypothetical protein GCM10010973_23600 [Cribrihabitans marinus]